MESRIVSRLACLALVLLAALGTIEAADASSRILLRFTVRSFDSPVTELFDELVCETSPPSQAGTEAGRATRLAVGVSTRLAVAAVAPHPESPALSSGITRSPPAVQTTSRFTTELGRRCRRPISVYATEVVMRVDTPHIRILIVEDEPVFADGHVS